MTSDRLRHMLGYDTVQDMLDIVGMKHRNMMRIKTDNPDRHRMILNDIIMKHYNVNTDGLIDMMELHRKQSA